MLAMMTPCEPPARSPWHFVSGVSVLSLLWGCGVMAFEWWTR